MSQDISGISSNLQKTIDREQLDQVVEAILAGKYSWACVLMLRFAGYNPLHYIPYRTYNRLLKDNAPAKNSQQKKQENILVAGSGIENKHEKNLQSSCLSQIKDLAYLEVVSKQKTEVRGGGHLDPWLSEQIRQFTSHLN